MARSKTRWRERKDPADTPRTGVSIRTFALTSLVAAISVGAWIFFHRGDSILSTQGSARSGPAFTKQGRLTIRDPQGNERASIDIEIAEDDYKREIGLMDRASMGEMEGMLFVFPQERDLSFWMKNTIMPLDMIFVNGRNLIVTVQRNTKPFSEESYSSSAPALYVVEVNAGFAERHGITPGDSIEWSRQ